MREMQAYLQRLGIWGTEAAYTDAAWPDAFLLLCEMLEAPDPARGMPFRIFARYHQQCALVPPRGRLE